MKTIQNPARFSQRVSAKDCLVVRPNTHRFRHIGPPCARSRVAGAVIVARPVTPRSRADPKTCVYARFNAEHESRAAPSRLNAAANSKRGSAAQLRHSADDGAKMIGSVFRSAVARRLSAPPGPRNSDRRELPRSVSRNTLRRREPASWFPTTGSRRGHRLKKNPAKVML